MGAGEQPNPEQDNQVAQCVNEVADFCEEIEKKKLAPVDVILVFRGADGGFGMRSAGAGGALLQVGMLEAAKAVVLSRVLQAGAANDPAMKAAH